MEECKIYIWTKRQGAEDECQTPVVTEGITWETTRKGEPSKLTFTCVKTDKLSFPEGAPVSFYYGDTPVFRGYVFSKSRDKEQHIQVTCYDQTRYMANKDTCLWNGIRADQVLTRIANDVGFKLKKNGIANTGYVIPTFDKSDMTLFDIILDALDETVLATKNLFYMYDDFGEIVLKNIKDSVLKDFIIDDSTAENFDYTGSIDSNTYNRIIVTENNSDSDKSSAKIVAQSEDTTTQKKWGILQLVINTQSGSNAKALADAALKTHNLVSRSLKINGQMGNIKCRAGVGIYTHLNVGDDVIKNVMLVEKATHTFDNDHHYMDLTLNGKKEFYD